MTADQCELLERGTQSALMDVMMPEADTRDLLQRIHDFYLREIEFWVGAEVDAIMFMDDWGAQNQFLIPPDVWRDLFKPLYKDYCDLAKAHGKFVFMHSDGHIAEIYEDLIEIGVDALNSQLFCMDLEDLARRAKGRITFWGEIDRQHVLPSPDPRVGRDAVAKVAARFYDPAGGIIAQFELGPGAHPDTARVIFEEWERWERSFRRQDPGELAVRSAPRSTRRSCGEQSIEGLVRARGPRSTWIPQPIVGGRGDEGRRGALVGPSMWSGLQDARNFQETNHLYPICDKMTNKSCFTLTSLDSISSADILIH